MEQWNGILHACNGLNCMCLKLSNLKVGTLYLSSLGPRPHHPIVATLLHVYCKTNYFITG